MKAVLNFRDWQIRWKIITLLIIASTLPLAIVAFIELRNERAELIEGVRTLLSARGDQVAGELDAFNRTYLKFAGHLSHLPEIIKYSQSSQNERPAMKRSVIDILNVWQTSDPAFMGVGIIGADGKVLEATEKKLIGKNPGFYNSTKQSLGGIPVISDLHFSIAEAGSIPIITYSAPVKNSDNKVTGVICLWVKAEEMWRRLELWNEKAGEGSFSVLLDSYGVRIGHSYSKKIVFHPAGNLDQTTIANMINEKRFGGRTKEYLESTKLFPEQFEMSRSYSPPSREVFHGFAPVNQQWSYGVPRRLETIQWTLFYMIPEKSLEAPLAALTNRLILLSLLIIVCAFAVGMLFARGILLTIKSLTETADALSGGRLNFRADVKSTDELGRLGKSFNLMAEKLEAMIESEKQTNEKLQTTIADYVAFAEKIGSGDLTIRLRTDSDSSTIGRLGISLNDMAGRLNELSTQIKEGTAVLSSVAAEILSSTVQVASSIQETASSVSETTTTVEEVKQTAHVSSQKAKYVMESSQKAAHVSQNGKKSVDESISMMNKIREQIELVAESIIKLSEQSQAIGEIISTVNDLADQSNLLAVNAAIEAAKAGEQGKGFTVVAQEVKSLSEQSKHATAQVRTILSDLQRAMNSAVLATEQGTKSVEAGVSQSAEAGESIKILAENITEAAQAATQIAASSQQQLAGIDQIAQAMENIKHSSTQNVAGTQQAETAVKNLNDLGKKLKDLVEQYKV
ncbi:MAG: HAMP domain-containing protein [Ignavibacteriales bacterium]|nr:HAMP domain-containing protein [Ignavibacteriales bacterium]